MRPLAPKQPNSLRTWSGIALLFIVPLILMSPHWFYWTDNSDLTFAIKWLFLPCSAFAFWVMTRPWVNQKMSKWERYLTVPALAFLLIVLLDGPILVLNAYLPPQTEVLIEGKMIEQSPSSNRSKARVILKDTQGNIHKWPVHGFVYAQLQLGQSIRLRLQRGGLGILFVDPGALYWELNPPKAIPKP